MDASRGPVALQTLLLGTIFTALALLSDGAYVLLAGALGGRLRTGGGSAGASCASAAASTSGSG